MSPQVWDMSRETNLVPGKTVNLVQDTSILKGLRNIYGLLCTGHVSGVLDYESGEVRLKTQLQESSAWKQHFNL